MAAPAQQVSITDQKKYQEFLDEGVRALEHYKASGLHLTGQEVNQWIDQVTQGRGLELPGCHK